jgi:hypothetical protein
MICGGYTIPNKIKENSLEGDFNGDALVNFD